LGDGALCYTLCVGQDAGLASPFRLDGLAEAHAHIENLRIGTRYFWKVFAWQNGQLAAESAVWSFTTHSQPPRWIYIPGITNVRDLGGWPLVGGGRIRQGLIFRSSEMNSHLSITAQGRYILEQQLGIRTDIDLRGSDELRQPVLDETRVAYFNFPIQSYGYFAKPENWADYREVFRLLANPQCYPLILHCWGGADRTGTAAFLLGAVLGVETASLVRDYELTSLSIWGERKYSSSEFQGFLKALAGFAAPGTDVQTQAEGYLRAIGVTAAEIASIRAIMLEEAGEQNLKGLI
jgi:protein tyrosine/serine phosphatase